MDNFDPLRFAIALTPLAAYCFFLAWLNLRARPTMATGGGDLAALALALIGLAAVGPIELLMPVKVAARFGNYVWVLMLGIYALLSALIVLLSRPRLVVYNIGPEELRPAIANVVAKLDQAARWAGDSVAMPTLGVQLHLDNFSPMRHISLVASGQKQNHVGWYKLAGMLKAELSEVQVTHNPRGLMFLGIGAALLLAIITRLLVDPIGTAIALQTLSH